MARTTIDLDDNVLRELHRRRDAEHRPMGAIASELLAAAMAGDREQTTEALHWNVADLGLRIDLEDKDALWDALDGR